MPYTPTARLVMLVILVTLTLPAGSTAQEGAPEQDLRLIDAVRTRSLDTARSLVEGGADVNATQPDGATALHWAAYREDVAAVDLLLAAGADVGATNELGATPLWVAAINGNATVLTKLLDAGADPNVALPEGETPVMTASRAGKAEAVEALLARGADPNATEHTRGQSALMWATAQQHVEVVKTLVAHGADINARSKVRPRLVFADNTNASQFDQGIVVKEGGFTPLLFAARQGAMDSAVVLLDAGADVDGTAPTGASALVVAAHSGHADLVDVLLERGADPNADGAGYAALHAAVLRGDASMIQTLLDAGADPNARLEQGTQVRRASQDWQLSPRFVTATPFWLAARYREPEIMRLLAEHGADPGLTTLELFDPVKERAGGVGPPQIVGGFVTPMMAAVRGRSDRGRLTLSGRDVDRQREEVLALEALTVAHELGNDVNAVDETGTTALHTAASVNFTSVVRYLADHGADLDVENKAGQTPLSLAEAAEGRRALRTDTLEDGPSTADVLRELGAKGGSSDETR